MKKMMRNLLLIMVMLSALLLAGCGNAEEDTGDTQVSQSESSAEESSEKDVSSDTASDEDSEDTEDAAVQEIPANQNLLTGLADLTDEAIGKRPVAVMVNNVATGFPQFGITRADIIFEVVVEANQTRFMAMYGDYTQVPMVGTIRSARTYFPAFAEGFDAIFVHWGMNSGATSYISSLGLTKFDGIYNDGNLFGRSQERIDAGYGLEHTSYFNGTKLAAVMEDKGYRTDLEADKTGTAFLFNGMNEQIAPEGQACTAVKINFGSTVAEFTYNEESKTYLKDHNGKAQVDGDTGKQLEFTNLIVLEAKIGGISGSKYKTMDWHGGAGQYVSNGAVQQITWSKESEEAPLKLFDENGSELYINRGKSYIAVNYAGQATFE